MKSIDAKILGVALAGTGMIASAAVAPLAVAASTPDVAAPAALAAEASAQTVQSGTVKLAEVQGTFSFDQTSLTSNAAVMKAFQGSSKYLCGAEGTIDMASVPLDEWTITVSGDVQTEFTATLADLANDNAVTMTMGCACAGNGADMMQAANVEVTGVTLMDLMREAGISPDANTVTFVSADGYSVSLPLDYVKQRYTLIVYSINGEPLQNSMGGTNQLWLGSTAAMYFSRDIVAIEFSCEDVVPPAPGTEDAYANAPGIGVTTGTA